MRKIKILKLCFNNEIQPTEIAKFRGAVIEKAGKENVLFHNHLNDEEYRYKYPLIQYKLFGGKAGMMCISAGTEEVNSLFKDNDLSVRLGNKEILLDLKYLKANTFVMQIWDKMFNYYLRHWIALNTDNYKAYKQLDGMADKVLFLEKILKGNILALAEGVGVYLDKEVVVKITDIKAERVVKYKGTIMSAFDLDFKTNFFIPNYLGLGKGVSLGFGTVKEFNGKN